MNTFKIAQIQPDVIPDLDRNLQMAERMIAKAVSSGAQLICLPEMFCCPYSGQFMRRYAEAEGGRVWRFCSELAKRHRVYLSAGSVPESAGGHIFNTAYVFDRDGKQIAKYRKTHLFDVDIEGGVRYKESDVVTADSETVMFDTELCKMGLCVCYDVRFPELARKLVLAGARLLLIPASFNTTTGPAHWELTMRARALDNQCYVIATAPANNPEAGYKAYGHSIVCDPWGRVVSQLGTECGIAVTEIDLDYIEKVRKELPLLEHRREELY